MPENFRGDFFDSHCTSGPINTWMGDRLWADKPSQYVTSHPGRLNLRG